MILIADTDKGLVRQTNQDKYECRVINDNFGFVVVCDGMGGQNGGNIASEITVNFAREMLDRDLKEDMSEMSLRAVMESAAHGANALVYSRAVADKKLEGMGTTLVICVFRGRELFILYAGDSRVYVASPAQEKQLTKDHTVVQMLMDIGEISQNDVKTHPKRHYITRAIGVGEKLDIDYIYYTLSEDELILICTDGLYHYMERGTMYKFLRNAVKEKNVSCLMDLAKQSGGSDNITAVVADISSQL